MQTQAFCTRDTLGVGCTADSRCDGVKHGQLPRRVCFFVVFLIAFFCVSDFGGMPGLAAQGTTVTTSNRSWADKMFKSREHDFRTVGRGACRVASPRFFEDECAEQPNFAPNAKSDLLFRRCLPGLGSGRRD